jgi:hypothetical protein
MDEGCSGIDIQILTEKQCWVRVYVIPMHNKLVFWAFWSCDPLLNDAIA